MTVLGGSGMRGTVAKRLRRKVYGKGHHPGPVQYYISVKSTTTRVSDRSRWDYQLLKREYVRCRNLT
jgi:hypothetical protein